MATNKSHEVDATETAIFITRCAEQCERYHEMLEYLEPVIQEKGCKMTPEERVLFTVACKNII